MDDSRRIWFERASGQNDRATAAIRNFIRDLNHFVFCLLLRLNGLAETE
jgi:hypothetical protein